jgi:hypothetical protein
MLLDGDGHVHTRSVELPDGEVLVHTTATGILVDKVDEAVVGTHELLNGVVLDGSAGSGPLVDTPGKVLSSVALPAYDGQPSDVCGGVPGSLVQLEMMAEHWLEVGMVIGVRSDKDLGNSSLGKQRSCLAASLPKMSGHLWWLVVGCLSSLLNTMVLLAMSTRCWATVLSKPLAMASLTMMWRVWYTLGSAG